MKLTLALGFLFTAAIYASVGFGGGSTYTALLAISGIAYTAIPIVSLVCNICVVTSNSWRYLRGGFIKLSQVWPLFALSVPAAMLGGLLNVSEVLFIGLLSAALLIAGLRLLFSQPESEDTLGLRVNRKPVLSGILGGIIGFYSGIVGIGGGIFLAPILYRLRWGQAQTIAATCSFFILVNSLAGLSGQLIKLDGSDDSLNIVSYWPLILAVIIGGTLGNSLSLRAFNPQHLRRITGVLILLVAIRLSLKWLYLVTKL